MSAIKLHLPQSNPQFHGFIINETSVMKQIGKRAGGREKGTALTLDHLSYEKLVWKLYPPFCCQANLNLTLVSHFALLHRKRSSSNLQNLPLCKCSINNRQISSRNDGGHDSCSFSSLATDWFKYVCAFGDLHGENSCRCVFTTDLEKQIEISEGFNPLLRFPIFVLLDFREKQF